MANQEVLFNTYSIFKEKKHGESKCLENIDERKSDSLHPFTIQARSLHPLLNNPECVSIFLLWVHLLLSMLCAITEFFLAVPQGWCSVWLLLCPCFNNRHWLYPIVVPCIEQQQTISSLNALMSRNRPVILRAHCKRYHFCKIASVIGRAETRGG